MKKKSFYNTLISTKLSISTTSCSQIMHFIF